MSDNYNARPYCGEIEQGIPLPPQNAGGPGIYRFGEMVPGDSFVTDSPQIIMIARTWAKRRKLDWRFSVRFIGNGRTRIWRVK